MDAVYGNENPGIPAALADFDAWPAGKDLVASQQTCSDGACWFSRSDRPQNEIKEIAGVSGNTITFTSPLHKSYRTANHAELTTFTGDNLRFDAGTPNVVP